MSASTWPCRPISTTAARSVISSVSPELTLNSLSPVTISSMSLTSYNRQKKPECFRRQMLASRLNHAIPFLEGPTPCGAV